MLRLRKTWWGKLVLQRQDHVWNTYCDRYIEYWRDATTEDILSGTLKNQTLSFGNNPVSN